MRTDSLVGIGNSEFYVINRSTFRKNLAAKREPFKRLTRTGNIFSAAAMRGAGTNVGRR